ncbi:Sugar fermentation stimulation protein homolog [Coccomyxa sp. Obi]|nr:Sugar fermentation stimulation protein homolog [Coccomyxa sp. Obi]
MASQKVATQTKRRKLDSIIVHNLIPTAAFVCCTSSIARQQSPVSTRYSTRAAAARSIKDLDGSDLGTGVVSEQVNVESKPSDLSQVREVLDIAVATLDSQAAPEEVNSSFVVREITGLVTGRLVKRYKRFLADIQIDGQGATSEDVVVHCPNTGPMTGLLDLPLENVWLSTAANTKRKYAHTLEAIQPETGGPWVGVHSASANGIVHTLLQQRLIADLLPYTGIRKEVKYGEAGKSRVDFVLDTPGGGELYVEVKSVTLAESLNSSTSDPQLLISRGGDGAEDSARIGLFPDTVSERAQRHVRDLMSIVAAGGQAAMVFVIQRGDCAYFGPCHAKDPVYGQLVIEAAAAGVRVIALRCILEGDEEKGRGIVRYIGPAQILLQHGLS